MVWTCVPLPHRRRLTCIGAAVCLGLLLAARASTADLSHAQFVKQADALCAAEASAIAGLPAPRDPYQDLVFLGFVIPSVKHLIQATLALPAPRADEPL